MSFNHYYQSELTALRQLGKRFAERSPVFEPFLGQVQEMNIRKTSLALLLPAALVFVFVGAIHAAINRDAQVSIHSPSGRFILQNVPLAPWSDLAYLRVTDTQKPQGVFRTPLYDMQYTDMRPHEDDRAVGTYWIEFDKQEKTFEIGVPQWQNCWLNAFISNTPYRINEN